MASKPVANFKQTKARIETKTIRKAMDYTIGEAKSVWFISITHFTIKLSTVISGHVLFDITPISFNLAIISVP